MYPPLNKPNNRSKIRNKSITACIYLQLYFVFTFHIFFLHLLNIEIIFFKLYIIYILIIKLSSNSLRTHPHNSPPLPQHPIIPLFRNQFHPIYSKYAAVQSPPRKPLQSLIPQENVRTPYK